LLHLVEGLQEKRIKEAVKGKQKLIFLMSYLKEKGMSELEEVTMNSFL